MRQRSNPGSKRGEPDDAPAKVLHVRMGRPTVESVDGEFKSSTSRSPLRTSTSEHVTASTRVGSSHTSSTARKSLGREQDLTLQSLDRLPKTTHSRPGSGSRKSSAGAGSGSGAGAASSSLSYTSPGRRSTTDSFVDLFSDAVRVVSVLNACLSNLFVSYCHAPPPPFPVHVMQKIVRLNIGGQIFATSRETLTRDQYCMLTVLANGDMPSTRDDSGAFFIGTILHAVLTSSSVLTLTSLMLRCRVRQIETQHTSVTSSTFSATASVTCNTWPHLCVLSHRSSCHVWLFPGGRLALRPGCA